MDLCGLNWMIQRAKLTFHPLPPLFSTNYMKTKDSLHVLYITEAHLSIYFLALLCMDLEIELLPEARGFFSKVAALPKNSVKWWRDEGGRIFFIFSHLILMFPHLILAIIIWGVSRGVARTSDPHGPCVANAANGRGTCFFLFFSPFFGKIGASFRFFFGNLSFFFSTRTRDFCCDFYKLNLSPLISVWEIWIWFESFLN